MPPAAQQCSRFKCLQRVCIFLLASIVVLIWYWLCERPEEIRPEGIRPEGFKVKMPVLPRDNVTFSNDVSLCELVSPGPPGYSMLNLLQEWPANRTRGFIYVLINPKAIDQALTLIENVYNYFNKRYDYPFVILSESSDIASKAREAIKGLGRRASLLGRVFAYDITRFWNVPDFVLQKHDNNTQKLVRFSLESIKESGCPSPKDLNYWLMCRFQAKEFLEIPFVRNFDYVWRLDKDSELCGEIRFDIFSYMKQKKYWLGYVHEETTDWCAQRLTEHVHSFVSKYNITPAQGGVSIADSRNNYVYNNFEIFSVPFYLSEEYRLFMNYTDRSGGFFYYRWGDAPLRTQSARLFMPLAKMKRFKQGEIYYKHQHVNLCTPVS